MRALLSAIVTSLALAMPSGLAAQFGPVVTVNDRVISQFEIDQRVTMLQLFRTPGNLQELAREQLIEDRLKGQILDQAGLRITDDGLSSAMSDFAGRADMTLDQFLRVLQQSGVAEETLRDFVKINVSWRDYIRNRFGDRAEITDAEVNQALGQAGAVAGVEVLLSEIIIPAPPPRAAQAMATAQRIAQLRSTSAFEAEARRHSALPSRTRGGRLDWLPITNYPPALRGIILDLEPGEVTAPLPITNGVALFQMRGVREVTRAPAEPASIEYAAFYIAGGLTEQALAEAARIDARVDTCDDLYGVAYGLPEERLQRDSLPPAEIPQDVAMELAKLDANETSYGLTRSNGDTLVFLMLCERVPATAEGQDREAIRGQLRSQRLSTYADALLADQRASARIVYH